MATVFMTVFAFADDPPTDPGPNDPGKKIYITSDSLVSGNDAKYAEFIGNVKATQGLDVITADRLKIFFKKTPQSNDNLIMDQKSIAKIVANGHVTIHFDNKVAVAEQAVYITATRVLVLSGPNSKIVSGSDSVAGEKITIYRTDGRINVESGGEKRVNAVFFSGGKGSN
ncbi:MAG: LptA/OstA family protein [Candidatus Desulfatibia sp.]|uniref:LptA/OstA family protein n=1 Tax=Candidatus Desulfatibia sp. TaxID=3101189 RepID=UPI002F2C69E5